MAVATQSLRSRLFKAKTRPFQPAPTPERDTSADTMVNQAAIETVFADTGWKSTILNRLSDVEDLLDCLEANGIADREVEARGNCKFNVRWRVAA